ncbi:MAG: hypothetical protein LBD13_07935 [Spirochaetaceae bacterium]|jgi:hypothetical protein|nr:hypothetical protein [Spirochaetaceae bacterium]
MAPYQGPWTGVLCILFPFFFSFFFPPPIAAQEIPADMPQRARILYQIDFDEDFFFIAANARETLWDQAKEDFPESKDVWRETLESTLRTSGNIAQVILAQDGEDLFARALSHTIPAFMRIHISGDIETGDVIVRYMFRGVFSDYALEGGYKEVVRLENDLAAFFWLPLRSDLEAFLQERVIRPPLLIRGPAGTVVYGFTPKPVRIPESEYIFVDVPMPGTYKWKMAHGRYMNRKGIFVADRDRAVITLPRDRFSFGDILRFFDGNNRAGKPDPSPAQTGSSKAVP